MFDDFVWRALAAGVGVALISGPIGCVVTAAHGLFRRYPRPCRLAWRGAGAAVGRADHFDRVGGIDAGRLALTVLQRVSGLSADLARLARLGLVALALALGTG